MSELELLHNRFCEYALVFKGNTPKTIKGFQGYFKEYLKFSRIEKLEQLTRENVEDWVLNGKLELNWSPKTIKNKLQSLRAFMDWCLQRKLVETNYIREIPMPKLPKSLPKHLSKDEAQRLLDWTRNYSYPYRFDKYRSIAIIATFLFTGIRLSELRNLKMEDVDIESRTLFVKDGKGMKDRVIPMNMTLITHLENYLKERRRLKKTNPYFFSAMRQDSQMGDLVIKRLVQKIREKSKIHFYPHLLRHTFATLMLEGGCDIFSLSKMMGHSDIKTTTIYLSATTVHLQEQIIKHPLNF